jgi:hypothetical protein
MLFSVSLESVNFPGRFLRHQDFRIKLHQYDGTVLFRQDASFMYQDGNDPAGNGGFSLESVDIELQFLGPFVGPADQRAQRLVGPVPEWRERVAAVG